jgi:hypothetical protein
MQGSNVFIGNHSRHRRIFVGDGGFLCIRSQKR